MKVTAINDDRANLELSNREIKAMQCILIEVKNILDHEPEFETRVGRYYAETQALVASLSDNYLASLKEIITLNNILNEACNGINIKDFDIKIGISEEEAKTYLRTINKGMKEMQNFIER
jgi:PIN domain nuclease of toxin-antitoxin system